MKSDHKTFHVAESPSENSIQILPAQNSRKQKNGNRHKSDLVSNFIAPDGGWGWIVVIAAALSILITFGVLEQFEILFKQKVETDNGFNRSQMTIIVNIQHVAATCTALFNGEMFRRFTLRQISFAGAILTSLGLALTAFFDFFVLNILSLSILCGIGRSLIFSSSYIAVNAYFKERRLPAFACMYSIVGLGTILLPQVTTFLMGEYGFAWTVLFYSGLSVHNFVSSLLYHPVEWHSKKPRDIELLEIQPFHSVFGSRHLEKLSALEYSTNSNNNLSKMYNFPNNSTAVYPLRVPKNSFASFEPLRVSRSIPKIILPDETEYLESPQEFEEFTPKVEQKLTIFQRISIFLDLDLLRDFSFVNLALGLTLINLVEISFTHMTPFILNDFNDSQIKMATNSLAICDLLMRMSIPIVIRKLLRCSNEAVLLCALIGLCLGRTVLAFDRSFTVVLICFGWMGMCTGIRIVFWMLILPGFMPLERLPAGIGLQQVAEGLILLAFGQVKDLFEGASNFNSILLCMNGIYLFVGLAWLGQNLFKLKRKFTIPPLK